MTTNDARDADYVPTLREYAEVIDFLAEHPFRTIPKRLERAYDDARHRVALHQFAEVMQQSDGRVCSVCGQPLTVCNENCR